jgi:pyruvate dehydrogenase E2 component (dihydrolipoamide acetyltransferase)
MSKQIFNLPDVGEGLTEADIVSWKVKPGDTVAINDILCEIETAKSLVELPSPYEGTVLELLAPEHETIEVGSPIIAIGSGAQASNGTDDGGRGPSAPAPSAAVVEAVNAPVPEMHEPGVEMAPLVGSGPKADAVKRRARKQSVPATEKPELAPAVGRLLSRVLAKPPVRRIAKDLGIDLADVPATGARGEVTRADVESYQAQREREIAAAPTFWEPTQKPQDERIEVVPVRGVRKATAKAMVDSAFSAPHVSIFVDVDASRTMEFVQRLKKSRDFENIKVSPLLILAKAVIWAAARNPSVNSEWVSTSNGDEIHVKHFMNLGIAAATPRGLLVPNIKNAQDLSLKELAIALNELATTARAGKTKPADMQGGTMTITNIGALGIDIGTPIINPGEVAIVAFGTIKQKPWVVSGEVIPRWITTLGGSFDHRVVDGDLSARFMADVAAIMEEPALLLD